MKQLKLESKKKGIYYCRLGIEEDNFEIAENVDYYVTNRNEKVTSVAAILESFSVLNHPELKKIYDSFVEKGLEDDFLTLIGSQFCSFYYYYYECLIPYCEDNREGLLELLGGKNYYLEKSLPEKVLKVAKRLEELEREGKGFFIDDKKELTKDTVGILLDCYYLEKDSSIKLIEKECKRKGYVEKEIEGVFFGLLSLISQRESILFTISGLRSNLDVVKEKFFVLRFFAVENSSNCLKSFSKDLFKVVDSNKSSENMNIKNETDRFLSILKKFFDDIKECSKRSINKGHWYLDDRGECRLLCSEKYSSLTLFTFEQFRSSRLKEKFSYRKAWKEAFDFLETYEKHFLESSSLPLSSEKADASRIVVQDERGTFFKDRWGVILLFLILTIIPLGFLLGQWIHKKNKSWKQYRKI